MLIARTAAGAVYVVPVATAKDRDRTFTTTLVLHNAASAAVQCESVYAIPNDRHGGTLRSTFEVSAHTTHVQAEVLREAGAVGTLRIECTGEVLAATRIRESRGGAAFDAGRVFRGIGEDDPLTSGASRRMTTTRDVVVMEVAGAPVRVHTAVRDAEGTELAERAYELPAFAHQRLSAEGLRNGAVSFDFTVEGGGAVVVQTEGDATAVRLIASAVPRPSATRNPTSGLPASFKAAPFQDPATGLIMLRDRWYDPSTGTFISPDREGYADSANPYLFGKGDPVNRSDPTGRLVKFTGKDPWGDFFLFRDSLHNPAAAGLLTLQGDAKRGYVLGLRPGVTKAQFLATATPDPPTYLTDLAAQGIPLPTDRRTVEEKIFDLMSSMHTTEFATGASLTRLSSWPFSWIPRTRTFQEQTIRYGGAVTLEPFETPTGNTAIAVNPVEINNGSTWAAAAAYNISFDPQIATMHEFGHALAYHDNKVACFQMWSVYLENQIRARRGERMFRFSERPLIKDPKTLLCP